MHANFEWPSFCLVVTFQETNKGVYLLNAYYVWSIFGLLMRFEFNIANCVAQNSNDGIGNCLFRKLLISTLHGFGHCPFIYSFRNTCQLPRNYNIFFLSIYLLTKKAVKADVRDLALICNNGPIHKLNYF